MTARPARKDLVLVIHGTRADQPELRQLVDRAREQGHAIRPRITWEAGDAETFAREGAAAGADAVVAVGGDGTVNEVLNGLAGSDVPMGIIPLGTANDFARQVDIPDDPEQALQVVLQGTPVHMDTAELNGRRFLNVSSGGIGAEATAETAAEVKDVLGALAYAITGVKKLADFEARRARWTAPGIDREFKFLLFAVGNARHTGGGVVITPNARTADGLLDRLHRRGDAPDGLPAPRAQDPVRRARGRRRRALSPGAVGHDRVRGAAKRQR